MQENTAKTKKDKTTLLMTDGNIWKLLIVFSIPLILGNLLQQMYNTADSIIVGNFVGSNGLAAVGAGTALINLIIAFAQGAAVGAGVVVSQYLGANRKQQIKISVHYINVYSNYFRHNINSSRRIFKSVTSCFDENPERGFKIIVTLSSNLLRRSYF